MLLTNHQDRAQLLSAVSSLAVLCHVLQLILPGSNVVCQMVVQHCRGLGVLASKDVEAVLLLEEILHVTLDLLAVQGELAMWSQMNKALLICGGGQVRGGRVAVQGPAHGQQQERLIPAVHTTAQTSQGWPHKDAS